MHIKFFRKKEIRELFFFILIGGLNTIGGSLSMLLLYNNSKIGYWGSSIIVYLLGSIISFFANKYITFRSNKFSIKEILKFVINILVCYIFAYSLALPLVKYILSNTNLTISLKMVEQLSMLIGMILFTVFNFLGQKLYIFKS